MPASQMLARRAVEKVRGDPMGRQILAQSALDRRSPQSPSQAASGAGTASPSPTCRSFEVRDATTWHRPEPGDVALFVEVADTSLRTDHMKLLLYARSASTTFCHDPTGTGIPMTFQTIAQRRHRIRPR
jgi:hypothetical protein